MGKTKQSGNCCWVPGCCIDGDLSNIKSYSFPAREGEKSEHPNIPAYIPIIFPEKYYGTQKNTKTVQLRAQNRFARAMRRSQNPSGFRMEKTKLANVRTCDVPNENIDIHPDSLHIIQPLEPKFRETATQEGREMQLDKISVKFCLPWLLCFININLFEDNVFKQARDARNSKRKKLQSDSEKRKEISVALTKNKIITMALTWDENTPIGLLKRFFHIAAYELAWRGGEAINCKSPIWEGVVERKIVRSHNA
ncbi:hypothetical protein PV326_010267 [Microctonus aethiopoides]|nr:hypothetical protein PV326_010267 [Microctonus aethiopoides]